ncbi:hypothetical protein HK101_007834 [Irineochytrium annulatum]|nr:hypothetical protein HK101_007834 [Irineochytrium annulatum]
MVGGDSSLDGIVDAGAAEAADHFFLDLMRARTNTGLALPLTSIPLMSPPPHASPGQHIQQRRLDLALDISVDDQIFFEGLSSLIAASQPQHPSASMSPVSPLPPSPSSFYPSLPQQPERYVDPFASLVSPPTMAAFPTSPASFYPALGTPVAALGGACGMTSFTGFGSLLAPVDPFLCASGPFDGIDAGQLGMRGSGDFEEQDIAIEAFDFEDMFAGTDPIQEAMHAHSVQAEQDALADFQAALLVHQKDASLTSLLTLNRHFADGAGLDIVPCPHSYATPSTERLNPSCSTTSTRPQQLPTPSPSPPLTPVNAQPTAGHFVKPFDFERSITHQLAHVARSLDPTPQHSPAPPKPTHPSDLGRDPSFTVFDRVYDRPDLMPSYHVFDPFRAAQLQREAAAALSAPSTNKAPTKPTHHREHQPPTPLLTPKGKPQVFCMRVHPPRARGPTAGVVATRRADPSSSSPCTSTAVPPSPTSARTTRRRGGGRPPNAFFLYMEERRAGVMEEITGEQEGLGEGQGQSRVERMRDVVRRLAGRWRAEPEETKAFYRRLAGMRKGL